MLYFSIFELYSRWVLLSIVCYTAVESRGGALRDDNKNGGVHSRLSCLAKLSICTTPIGYYYCGPKES